MVLTISLSSTQNRGKSEELGTETIKSQKMGSKICFPLNMGKAIGPFLVCSIIMCFGPFGMQFRALLIFTYNHYSRAS